MVILYKPVKPFIELWIGLGAMNLLEEKTCLKNNKGRGQEVEMREGGLPFVKMLP